MSETYKKIITIKTENNGNIRGTFSHISYFIKCISIFANDIGK